MQLHDGGVMTKKFPGYHRRRRGFNIEELPQKPDSVHQREEEGDPGFGGFDQRRVVPIFPEDYLLGGEE